MLAVVGFVGVLAWYSLGGLHDAADPGESGPTPAGQGDPIAAATSRPVKAVAKVQVQVRVLRDDWATPMPDAAIHVFPFDPRRMRRPTEYSTVRADASGVAKLVGLADGAYWICAPGRQPGDDAPGSVRMDLRATDPQRTVVVAAKPDLIEVPVIVDTQFSPRDGFGSRLVLSRVDDGSRREWPFPRLVVPGRDQVSMALPAGSYELLLRPTGELLVEGGNSLFVIREGESLRRIALVENPLRSVVTLAGVPPEAFPVRVEVIPTDRIDDRRHALEWWGPTAWIGATATVPSLSGPHRVVVTSRSGTWCSEAAISPGATAPTIPVEPATRIAVVIESWQAPRDLEMVVDVDDGVVTYSRALLPTFGPEFPTLTAPALVGEIFVRRDRDLVLEARGAEGEVVWRRALRSEGAEQVLRIPTARPK